MWLNSAMNLEELQRQFIKNEIGISNQYGKIFSFIDFANVNNWFEYDTQTWDHKPLQKNETIEIGIKEIKKFTDTFSSQSRLYYGQDPKNPRSMKFTDLLRIIFGKKYIVTKNLQKIKHYLHEKTEGIKHLQTDNEGKFFVEIRKCNFDVEIAVEAISMLNHYDTFCLYSGDADFAYLNNFLRKKGKKIILIKAGFITSKLRKSAHLIINAQLIKKYISRIAKQRPD